MSQPVFARYLNTSESTVQKWEAGAKRPSAMALKLLSVVGRHGRWPWLWRWSTLHAASALLAM